jgi:hypothetical protein
MLIFVLLNENIRRYIFLSNKILEDKISIIFFWCGIKILIMYIVGASNIIIDLK